MLSCFTLKIFCSVMHTCINLFPLFIQTPGFSFSLHYIFSRYCLCCVHASQKTRVGENHIPQGRLSPFAYVSSFWTSNYERWPIYGKIALTLYFSLLNMDRWVQRISLFLSSKKHFCDSLWQPPPAPLIFLILITGFKNCKWIVEKTIAL